MIGIVSKERLSETSTQVDELFFTPVQFEHPRFSSYWRGTFFKGKLLYVTQLPELYEEEDIKVSVTANEVLKTAVDFLLGLSFIPETAFLETYVNVIYYIGSDAFSLSEKRLLRYNFVKQSESKILIQVNFII